MSAAHLDQRGHCEARAFALQFLIGPCRERELSDAKRLLYRNKCLDHRQRVEADIGDERAFGPDVLIDIQSLLAANASEFGAHGVKYLILGYGFHEFDAPSSIAIHGVTPRTVRLPTGEP